jgi:hypothetical protein
MALSILENFNKFVIKGKNEASILVDHSVYIANKSVQWKQWNEIERQ